MKDNFGSSTLSNRHRKMLNLTNFSCFRRIFRVSGFLVVFSQMVIMSACTILGVGCRHFSRNCDHMVKILPSRLKRWIYAWQYSHMVFHAKKWTYAQKYGDHIKSAGLAVWRWTRQKLAAKEWLLLLMVGGASGVLV